MKTILVIDDTPSQLKLMSMLVQQLGLALLEADSGHKGVQLAKERKPDLIVMDWIMPTEKLTGKTTLWQLKSDPETQEIPVVVCSAHGDLQVAIEHGCDEYLHKPYNPEDFRQMIKRYI